MKSMLRDIWTRDRRGFVMILLPSIAVSLIGGIPIGMLVPLRGLLKIRQILNMSMSQKVII